MAGENLSQPEGGRPTTSEEPVDSIAARALNSAQREAQVWKSKYNSLLTDQSASSDLGQLFERYAAAVEIPRFRADSRVPRVAKTEETVVLLLSDLHVGETVFAEAMHGLNRYDTTVFLARMDALYDRVVSIFIDHLSGYRFPELRIYLLGDLINGQFGVMHDELIVTQGATLMETVFGTSSVLCQFIQRMLQHFERIHICAAPGNHGRMTKKPWAKEAEMNWDMVIPKIVSQWFRTEPRVTFNLPNSFFFIDDIHGQTFCGFHGHQVKGWAGIPWYGINRFVNNLTEAMQVIGKPFDHVVLGHFHSEAQFERVRGRVLANPCMKGPDEYTLQTGLAPAPAAQIAFGVHPTHGPTHIWPIRLQDAYEPQGTFLWQPSGVS